MKLAVIGAGAVGGAIAALADRHGHEVTVTARGDHLDAIRTRGLHLSGAWGEHTAHPRASEALGEADTQTGPEPHPNRPTRPDLAVIAVKAQDAHAALAQNAAGLGGVPLVVVQNGLGGAEGAAAQLPSTPVIGGLALFATSFLDPGEIAVTAGGATYLGRLPGTPQSVVDDAAAVLSDFMPIELTTNFPGAQWTKLMVNHVNALPAITGLSVQQTMADARLRRVLTASMRETIGIARATGVRFETLLGLGDGLLRLMALAPRPLAELIPKAMAKRMGDVPNPGSTLQSIRRGQLTEIDHLNGAVVTVASDLGRPAPVNTALVDLVHAVERDHRFRTPAEVETAVATTVRAAGRAQPA
jgi:2-dehydropantoate 2-reductase